jgi:hypothetical protein
MSGGAQTSPIAQTISTAMPSTSNTRIPTRTTTSPASNTSSTTGTTNSSQAAANLVLASNRGLGGLLAFVAGMAALM